MIIAVWRTLLFLWLASILFVISLPWWKFDGTPHWDNVQWIPLNGYVLTTSTLIETGANFLAFIPIGYLAIRSFNAGAKRLLFVGLIGFAASFSIEVYQLFCHDRVPGSTDLLLNTAGAVLGAQLALKLDELICFISRRMPFASPNPNAEE
jgi:glycopeptide antibiotics resistance protein